MSDAEDDGERAEGNESDCQEPTGGEASAGGDSFNAAEEYQEAFGAPVMDRVIDDDGLPKPIVDDVLSDAHAPPFLPAENQCCAAILDTFVLRDEWGEIVARWAPDKVRRMPDGRYRARHDDAELPETEPERAEAAIDRGSMFTEVEPIRPQCKHLLLQLRPPEPSASHILKFGSLQRYCTVRRTVAGAFLSLSDEAMRACSMREPFDLSGAELLTEFDAALEGKSRLRTYHPMFKQDEPKKPAEPDLSALHTTTQAIIGETIKT
jgi:hypothetical protein